MNRMRNALKPLLLVLAVPVLVTAAGMLGRGNLDSRWSATLVRQLAAQRMRPDSRLLARYSLSSLCVDQRTGARFPPCRTFNFYSALIAASAAVGAAGFAYLGGLVLSGHLCRTSRRRMVWLFRPSLVFAASGTAVLAVVNALLAVAGVIAATTAASGQPIERVSTSLVLVAGTAAVVWAIAAVVAAFSVTRRTALTLVGQRLDPSAQRPLVDEVQRVADAVGAELPRNIVACLGSWVWVTEARVAILDGTLSGRTLCFSLPLCRILSIDEFRALLAHELAHFSRGQESYTRRVSPFYAGALQALDRLGRQALGIRGLAVAPAVTLLSFFMEAVGGDAEPGDDRETAADKLAVAVAGPDALGSALVKAHAFAPAWNAVVGAMLHAVASGTQYLNASALFHEVSASNSGPERLLGIGERELGHPTDRHAVLARRLDGLGVDLARVASAALVTAPPSPAILLVGESEALERRLSVAEHRLMAETA
jgi:Zn-dependent protease with chaperone function